MPPNDGTSMADPPPHGKSKAHADDALGYLGAAAFDGDSEGGAPLELSIGDVDPAPAVSARPLPSARAPKPPELSQAEVRIVAEYGDVPAAWYLAPAYAWRVKRRQRELRKRVASLAAELERAELARDAALAALASDLRSAAESDDRYADVLEAVRRIETVAGEQSAALASVSADREAELGRIDAERDEREAQLAERRQAKAAKAGEVELAERNHARADARLKRVHIEMRAVQETVQRSAGQQAVEIPPEHRARWSELQAQAQSVGSEVAEFAARLSALRAEHANLINQVDHLEAALGSLAARGHNLDVNFRKRLSARSHDVAVVEAERTRALANVGRALVRRARDLGVYRERVDAVDAAESALAKVSLDHARHLAALDAFDAAVVQRGVVMAAVGVALLLVLLWVLL